MYLNFRKKIKSEISQNEENMSLQSPNMKESQKIIVHVWIAAGVVLVVMFFFILYNTYFFRSERIRLVTEIVNLKDSVSTNSDSLKIKNLVMLKNKLVEDSLQSRIEKTIDTLEFLEQKLISYQKNSGITKEVIIGVLDSIDIYRKESELLKQEIDRINRENSMLLQQERNANSMLRKKIENYEKKLMGLYAINFEIIAYRDGHDQNSKLITTNKAKKVREIRAAFKLTRDLEESDMLTLELSKNGVVYAQVIEITSNRRLIKRSIKITEETTLSSGNYDMIVYQDNPKYDLYKVEIGRGFIELE